ncbi:transglutaminase family protein [Alteromonas halophila]|uniref:Protein-glutamine gamma-glutamyltransferase n=1 Tax=Alteromonas halophila TaxID=516698 RepID=A0A918JFC2_9ALTE|nr:DUF3488 and transglutaminase-like domain-containing protein [Alteromonas halophila]GGW76062.1 protein-glutamine gamma-glutamyltransferase [Alteromonas halophila]
MSPPRLPIAGHKASLTIAVLFALITLSLSEPALLWVMLLAGCSVMVRVALYLGWYHSAPSVRTINLLAVLCAIALAWFGVSLGLLLSMVNLLIMACALKLMIMTRRKDFLQLFTAMLFLIGCGFIFAQSISALTMYLVLLGLALLSLLSAFAPSLALIKQLRLLGMMFIQAAPIAVMLFLIMPQLSPLWKMPTAKSTATGLSEQVTPGDIASLSQSSELAFTASFDENLPPASERYWRALTLEDFDGKTWSVSQIRRDLRTQFQKQSNEFSPSVSGTSFRYQVIAEPTGQRWLYGIDIASPDGQSANELIWQGHDYQLIAREPLMSKRAYRLISYPAASLNSGHTRFDKNLNLRIPESGNPRTQALASQLRQRFSSDAEYAQAIMQRFADPVYRYTLEPEPMQTNPVDMFLFDKQAGFCSHYASTMAYLLRLANIPARMVTGYHGGEEISPNVFTVRQYDAHAWVEAWLGERGWVRFDPTSVVAPARLEFGLQRALEESGETINASAFDGLYQSAGFTELRRFFANVDYLWSRWVLGFDAHSQRNLFKRLLGELSAGKLAILFVCVLFLIAALLALYFLPSWQRQRIVQHQRLYLLGVEAVASYAGIPRSTQPPQRYCESIKPHLPEAARTSFENLTLAFIDASYRQRASSGLVSEMKQSLKQLRRNLRRKK